MEYDWAKLEIFISSLSYGGWVALLKMLTDMEAKLLSQDSLEGIRNVWQNLF